MIERGKVVIRLGDQRLIAMIDGGRLMDLWSVNDLGEPSRDVAELRAAIARIDGTVMILIGDKSTHRELSGHERMWLTSRLRLAILLDRIDAEAAGRTPEQTAEIEHLLGEQPVPHCRTVS